MGNLAYTIVLRIFYSDFVDSYRFGSNSNSVLLTPYLISVEKYVFRYLTATNGIFYFLSQKPGYYYDVSSVEIYPLK
jgi:hypothetical protein